MIRFIVLKHIVYLKWKLFSLFLSKRLEDSVLNSFDILHIHQDLKKNQKTKQINKKTAKMIIFQ